MYIVMNRLQSPASYAEHLERAFQHAGDMHDVDGFVSFQFLRGEPTTSTGVDTVHYVAITQWENRAAFEAWTKGEAFKHVHHGAGDSPVTTALECYEVLH